MVDEVTDQTAKELVNEIFELAIKEAMEREAAAASVIEASIAIQDLAASEVENLMPGIASEAGVSEQPASEEQPVSDEQPTPKVNPISKSTVAEIVSISSTSVSPSSLSSSSSSSTDIDDIPLSRFVPSLRNKTPSPSTKLHKEPVTDSFTPVYESVVASIANLQQIRIDKCKNLPANHPLQPPTIEAIQSIPASAEGASDLAGTDLEIVNEPIATPNSPNNQIPEQDVFSNLESHYSGELPEYQQQMTSDITSDEVVMIENPPQQHPNQIRDHIETSDSLFQSQRTKPDLETSVDPEPSTSDQTESDQSTSDQNPSFSNLSIELVEPTFSDIPKPPSVFLHLPFLATICLDIFKKAKQLIETRHDLAQAQKELKDWLKGVISEVHKVKVLRTWARAPLCLEVGL